MLTSTGSTEHGGLLKSPNGAPINSRNKALDKLEVFLLKTIKNIVDLPKREINHWQVQKKNGAQGVKPEMFLLQENLQLREDN